MRKITLNKNTTMDVTVVSNYFLDEYMVKANGEYVKIYLHLLRCCGSNIPVSINSIADTFECTEKDVLRALTYWEQIGLLNLEFDKDHMVTHISLKDIRQDTPVTFTYVPQKAENDTIILNIENSNKETTSATDTATAVVADSSNTYKCETPSTPVKKTYSLEELAAFNSNEDFKDLLNMAGTYLKKNFSPTDTNTLLFIYDTLQFDIDLIEFLICHCVELGKVNLKYIEKVAMDWHENGIITCADAKAHVDRYSKKYYPIMKALGLNNRQPATIELEYIDKWVEQYGFDISIILEACNKTITSISNPSIAYVDGILTKWKDKGVTSISDIKKLDELHAAEVVNKKATKSTKSNIAFNNFQQRTYDYDALERELLSRN